MAIDSDTNQRGESRGPISRTHENDRNTSVCSYFKKKRESKERINKKLLAMAIGSDTKQARRIAGSISRSYESVGNLAVYRYFERLFRPAVWGHGLPVQRHSAKRAVSSRSLSARRRYDHAPRRNL
jgi:hypothetical protein